MIKEAVIKHSPALFGLVEVGVKVHDVENITGRLFPHYQFVKNYDNHYNGRIWVFLLSVLAIMKAAGLSLVWGMRLWFF